MKCFVAVILLGALAGCATRPMPISEQAEYLERQYYVYAGGDLRARRLLAITFADLPPEQQSRFHLDLIDLRALADTGCNMPEMAKADLAQGHFNFLASGDPKWGNLEPDMWKYIAPKYGIEFFSFSHGGLEPSQYHELLGKYNAVVERAIERKLHKSLNAIYEEAARQVKTPTSAPSL